MNKRSLWQSKLKYYKLITKDSSKKTYLDNFRRSFTFFNIFLHFQDLHHLILILINSGFLDHLKAVEVSPIFKKNSDFDKENYISILPHVLEGVKRIVYIQIENFIRSSRLEVFCKKRVLRNFAKFTGKHLW